MTLISLISVLVVLGILMYVINVYVPMESTIKKILNVVVIIFLILWLMQALGLLAPLYRIKIGG